MLKLYSSQDSGNCYKARLLLAHLEIAYECLELDYKIDLADRPPEFLAGNPGGRVPLLVLDDGTRLPESNAILCYLADGTRYFPGDALARAQVLRWMFFEQNNHEPSIATARNWIFLRKEPEKRAAQIPLWKESGLAALGAMEKHLAGREFFGPQGYSIADIALFGYTHVADEGGFDLAPFGAIREWLDRVRAQPGWVPML